MSRALAARWLQSAACWRQYPLLQSLLLHVVIVLLMLLFARHFTPVLPESTPLQARLVRLPPPAAVSTPQLPAATTTSASTAESAQPQVDSQHQKNENTLKNRILEDKHKVKNHQNPPMPAKAAPVMPAPKPVPVHAPVRKTEPVKPPAPVKPQTEKPVVKPPEKHPVAKVEPKPAPAPVAKPVPKVNTHKAPEAPAKAVTTPEHTKSKDDHRKPIPAAKTPEPLPTAKTAVKEPVAKEKEKIKAANKEEKETKEKEKNKEAAKETAKVKAQEKSPEPEKAKEPNKDKAPAPAKAKEPEKTKESAKPTPVAASQPDKNAVKDSKPVATAPAKPLPKLASSFDSSEFEREMQAVGRQAQADSLANMRQAAAKAAQAEASRMAAEAQAEAARQAAANKARDLDAQIQHFRKQISDRIHQKWELPPGSSKELYALVRVVLLPGGEVQNIYFERSSGNPAFDRSVEAAIRKASPLPVPDGALFDQKFRILPLTLKQ